MKASEIKIKATSILTQKTFHFTLDGIDIGGNVCDGGFPIVITEEGKAIPYFSFDEYDFEVVGD